MITIDDPLPSVKRAGKACRETFFSLLRFTLRHKKGLGLFVILCMPFGYHALTTDAIAHSDKSHVVSEQSQRYATCVLHGSLAEDKLYNLTTELNSGCVQEALYGKERVRRTAHFKEILAGHPMEEMAELLAEEDEQVAAFIIGIGKIESNWGKRSPWKSGQDCYNYWGYKTSGSRGQALGHACFGSREEAVETIAKRLNYFVHERGKNTSRKLLVWKCGSSCATHSPEGVARWANVVHTYSQRALASNVDDEQKNHVAILSQ